MLYITSIKTHYKNYLLKNTRKSYQNLLYKNWRRALLGCAAAFLPPNSAAAQTWLNAKVPCSISSAALNAGIFNESDLAGGKDLGSVNLGMSCESNGYPLGYSGRGTVEGAYCLTMAAAPGQRYLTNAKDGSRIQVEFYSGTGTYHNDTIIGNGNIGGVLHAWKNGQGDSQIAQGRAAGNAYPLGNMPSNIKIKLLSARPGSYYDWGLYLGEFGVNWRSGTTEYAHSYPSVGNGSAICADYPAANAGTGNFTVQMTIKPHCTIAVAAHIKFSPQIFLDKTLRAQGQIKANCSSGTNYEVGIGEGYNSADGEKQRAMKREGGDELIPYKLCRDSACQNIWTKNWGTENVYKGKGTARDELLPVYAEVPPQTGGKPKGIYKDAVVIEVKIIDIY